MKLLRHGPPGREQPGILDGRGIVRSLQGVVDDLAGPALDPTSLDRLRALDAESLAPVEPRRLGPCVGSVGKVVCVGRNYADHAGEMGAEPPAEPLIFMKATSALCGPRDDLQIPRGATCTDWEVELAVVIGRRAQYVSEADAPDHVAGYCVINDVTERTFQKKRGGQSVKGKSHDSFAPLGPWLVTADEIPDPHALELWLDVDGRRMQHGSTSDMIFRVPGIVSYLSGFMTLHPGDVIATGTPPGVGHGRRPPQYLRPGQVVRFGVQGLGEQEHRTVAAG